jgi:hypothetical protein
MPPGLLRIVSPRFVAESNVIAILAPSSENDAPISAGVFGLARKVRNTKVDSNPAYEFTPLADPLSR